MCSVINYTPTTNVMLLGSLAKRFFRNKTYLLDGGSAVEVFRALNATIEGFAEEIRRLERLGLKFAIFRNRKNVGVDGFDLGGTREIRIVPVIGGM
ncbi:tail assembly protein [Pseudomonas sp. S2_B07]